MVLQIGPEQHFPQSVMVQTILSVAKSIAPSRPRAARWSIFVAGLAVTAELSSGLMLRAQSQAWIRLTNAYVVSIQTHDTVPLGRIGRSSEPGRVTYIKWRV